MISPFSRSGKSNPKFYCESCGREVPPEDSKCPRCGKEFKAVMCPRCGHSGHAGLFIQGCPVCGFQAPPRERKAKAGSGNGKKGVVFPDGDVRPAGSAQDSAQKKRAKTAFREYSGRVYAAVILFLAGVLALLLFLYFRL